MKQSEEDFLKQLKRELDADLEKIDSATMARLARSRREAVSRRAGRRSPFIERFAPGLAFAASTAMLAILLQVSNGSMPQLGSNAPLVELLLAQGELELIEELDFYRWLDANGYAG